MGRIARTHSTINEDGEDFHSSIYKITVLCVLRDSRGIQFSSFAQHFAHGSELEHAPTQRGIRTKNIGKLSDSDKRRLDSVYHLVKIEVINRIESYVQEHYLFLV